MDKWPSSPSDLKISESKAGRKMGEKQGGRRGFSGVLGRAAGVGRWRWAGSDRAKGGAEAVKAFAVVGETDQLPFERDFGQTAQREAPETEHFFDDAEDRFDGLLPEFVERAAGDGRRAVPHPFGKGRVRRRGRRVGPFFQLRHGAAVGFALQGGEDRDTGRGQLHGRHRGFAHKAAVDQQRIG